MPDKEVMRQARGMRARSPEEMEYLAVKQAPMMRQRGPLTSGEQQAMMNFDRQAMGTMHTMEYPKPPLSRWARFKLWVRAYRA